MAEKNKKKLSAFEQQKAETIKKVSEYKLQCEANVVAILYKDPEQLYNTDIDLTSFTSNVWKVFWQIAHDIIIVENKNTLDYITIGMYLNKHPKLNEKYVEYGGYDTITAAMGYVKEENLDGYVAELHKWDAVRELCEKGFPVNDRLSDYTDMSEEEIYNEHEAYLNHIFANSSSDIKSINVFDGMYEFIQELNECSEAGMPFYNADLLNAEVGGFNLNGNIYGLGAGSGCVDCDTEFFNGEEWKRIADYKIGDKVLQYNENGTAELVYPLRYIKNNSEYLWHFSTMYGLDQCLSDEHTVVYKSDTTGCGNEGGMNKIKFKDLRKRHEKSAHGFSGRFYTSFDYSGTGIDLSDDEIRLMVATFADGSFPSNYIERNNSPLYKQARFHLKKERKKHRLVELANACSAEWHTVDSAADGYDDYYVITPLREKHYPKSWYNCNKHQLQVIADEVMFWDGDYKKNNYYSTTSKEDADFIQFVYSSLGYRASISINDRCGNDYMTRGKAYTRKSVEYRVSYTKRNLVGMKCNKDNKVEIKKYKTIDGYEYCFTVPSHMLVLRRNNKIFITGNCGKSNMAFNWIIPSAMKYGEKVVMCINEEDERRIRKELLIWVANNIFNEELHKRTIRDGGFDSETIELLKKCADWIDKQKDEHILTVIPLERYSVNTVIKIIKKYSSAFGVRIFILDTLKESFDAKTDEIYKSMMRDMVALYDVVKPSAKNVGLFVTYQLVKGSLKMRYLTNNEIGQAKSIVDVMSVNLMMRRPYEDEYEGGAKEIIGYRPDGKDGKSKIAIKLKKDDNPMITFICKNRFGISGGHQVVSSCDLSTNTYKDIGYCNIPQDF